MKTPDRLSSGRQEKPIDRVAFNAKFTELFLEWKDKWVKPPHVGKATESSPPYYGPSYIPARVASYLSEQQIEAESPEMKARATLVDFAASVIAKVQINEERVLIIETIEQNLRTNLYNLPTESARLTNDILKKVFLKLDR